MSGFSTFHLGILSSFALLLVTQQVPAWEATSEKFKEVGNYKGTETTGVPLGRAPLTLAFKAITRDASVVALSPTIGISDSFKFIFGVVFPSHTKVVSAGAGE